MRKRIHPILIFLLVAALLVGGFLAWLFLPGVIYGKRANSIVRPKAEAYLAAQYPELDLEIADCFWSWFDNCYYVRVQSPTSRDTHFRLTYDTETAQLVDDAYTHDVLERRNTFSRIWQDYDALVNQVAEQHPELGMTSRFNSGLNPRQTQALTLDEEYDAGEVGGWFGEIELKCESDPDSRNLAAALPILREADRLLTEAGISYATLKITLTGQTGHADDWCIYGVTHEDLTAQDPAAILADKWLQQEEHREEVRASWNS